MREFSTRFSSLAYAHTASHPVALAKSSSSAVCRSRFACFLFAICFARCEFMSSISACASSLMRSISRFSSSSFSEMTFACSARNACKCGELYMFKAGSDAGSDADTADASISGSAKSASLSAACELTFDMGSAGASSSAACSAAAGSDAKSPKSSNPPSLTGATAGTASARSSPLAPPTDSVSELTL